MSQHEREVRDLLARVDQKLAEVRRLHAVIHRGGLSSTVVRNRVTQADDELDDVDAILDRARIDGILPKR